MIKFIYICMAVVAFSFLSIALQPMFKGIEDQRDAIAARNETAPAAAIGVADAAAEGEFLTPEALNAIETTAGGDIGVNQPDTGFSPGFTNTTPKGLEDSVQSQQQSPAEGGAPFLAPY
jgi:hypothetical protein